VKRSVKTDWPARVKTLKAIGYNYPKRLTAANKRNIAYVEKRHSRYLNAKDKTRVRFVKGKPDPKLVTSRQRTPTGFFDSIPKRVRKNEYKIAIEKDGALRYSVRGNEEIVVPLDPKGLTRDPRAEIIRAVGKRRPVGIRIVIFGDEGHEVFRPNVFFDYMVDLFFPERREGTARQKGMSWQTIAGRFKLKLIYPPKRAKQKTIARSKKKLARRKR
jgi:hypothetical protein